MQWEVLWGYKEHPWETHHSAPYFGQALPTQPPPDLAVSLGPPTHHGRHTTPAGPGPDGASSRSAPAPLVTPPRPSEGGEGDEQRMYLGWETNGAAEGRASRTPSFNSFGGPQAPFGGTTCPPALPAATPRGSPGSLVGGRSGTSRSGRARRDPGGGCLCKREGTWGCKAAGREHGTPSVRLCKRSRARPHERATVKNHCRERAVHQEPSAFVRRARVHLYKSVHRRPCESAAVCCSHACSCVRAHTHTLVHACSCASVPG